MALKLGFGSTKAQDRWAKRVAKQAAKAQKSKSTKKDG